MNCHPAIVAYTEHVRECVPSFTPYARTFELYSSQAEQSKTYLSATPTFDRSKCYHFAIEGNTVTPIDAIPEDCNHIESVEGRWFEEYFTSTAVPVAHVDQEDGRFLRNRGPKK